VHRWRDTAGRAWDDVELTPEGDLMVVGSDRGERRYAGAVCEDHYVERLGYDGASKWKVPLRAHHEIEETLEGDWMTLTASQRRVESFDASHDLIDNALCVLTPEGKVVEEQSLFDILSKPESHFTFQRVAPNPNPKFPVVDLLHSNSIEFVHDASLYGKHPIFAPQNVLICMRHQDSIAMIDWTTKTAIWSWGRGKLSGPHDARVLSNGHILVYDNGLDRSWTRVVEMDPASGEIVWEYRAVDRKSFFSDQQGSSQRLANGNTLIANSTRGEAFEVTQSGDCVWRYLVPYFNAENQRAQIYRIRRYETGFVDRILSEHAGSGGDGTK
jgi:hypothetical protein